MFKKILIPIDGSKHSNEALMTAQQLGEQFQAELYILTVIPETQDNHSSSPYSAELNKAYTSQASLILSDIQEKMSIYPYKWDTYMVTGKPAHEINSFAEEHDIDLIVMGNRGLGAFSRTLLGSVSSKVLNHSKASVLVVKAEIEED